MPNTRPRSLLVLLALLASVAPPAGAGTLVSPPILAPDATYSASCNATNSHTKSVEVTFELVDSNGFPIETLTSDVPPGATRSLSRPGPGFMACRLTFKGSDKKIVGSLYLFDASLPTAILLSVDAR